MYFNYEKITPWNNWIPNHHLGWGPTPWGLICCCILQRRCIHKKRRTKRLHGLLVFSRIVIVRFNSIKMKDSNEFGPNALVIDGWLCWHFWFESHFRRVWSWNRLDSNLFTYRQLNIQSYNKYWCKCTISYENYYIVHQTDLKMIIFG